MWNTPMFFYDVAVWQKIWGLSISYQRLLPEIVGLLIIVVITLLLLQDRNSRKPDIGIILLVLGLWVSNILISKSTRMARPDIFSLFFGLVGIYAAVKSFTKNDKRIIYSIVSGVSYGCAVLHHFIGVFFMIGYIITYIIQRKTISRKKFLVAIGAFITVITPWLIDVCINWTTYITQFSLSLEARKFVHSWITTDIFYAEVLVSLTIIGYIALFAYLIFLIVKKLLTEKTSISTTSLLLLITSLLYWIFSIKGKSEFYSIYPFTLTLILTCTLIGRELKQYKKNLVIILFAIILIQIYLYSSVIQRLYTSKNNYSAFAREVAKHIPSHSTVYLSTVPDPYYGIVKNKTIRIYEFLAVPISREQYTYLLSKSDYIVYNAPYNSYMFGEFVGSYIHANSESSIKVTKGGYSTDVIKLKPKNKRITDF